MIRASLHAKGTVSPGLTSTSICRGWRQSVLASTSSSAYSFLSPRVSIRLVQKSAVRPLSTLEKLGFVLNS